MKGLLYLNRFWLSWKRGLVNSLYILMKKIVLLLSIFTLSLSPLQAEEDIIDVEVSSNNISLDERVKYIVNISQDTPWELSWELKIPGLENFNIFSQQSWHSFESINWISTWVSQYTFDMSPKSEGEFSIGPVQVLSASWTYMDDEKLFIVVSENETLQESVIDISEEETKIVWEDDVERADFYTLREPKKQTWPLIVGTILFIIVFYLLLSLALWKNKLKKTATPIVSVEPKHDFHDEMKSYFEKLEKKSSSLESPDFLKIFNHGLRRILQREVSEDALSLTLTQLKQQDTFWDFELSKLFSKSYKAEYSQKNITDITKKKYIDEVRAYLD